MEVTFNVTSQFIAELDQVIKESVARSMKDVVVEDRIMTKKETAQFFQVSIPTLESFMVNGLPHFKHGHVIRFLYSEVVAWSKHYGKESVT